MPSNRSIYLCILVACAVMWSVPQLQVAADIYEWEYIDPANPSLGKRESDILLSSLNVGSAAVLDNLNLRKAYLRDAGLFRARLSYTDLTNAYLAGANLNSADFIETNLTNSDLSGAELVNTDFRGAILEGANFTDTTINSAELSNATSRGFTYDSLASTSSFKKGDISSLGLSNNNLSGWDLSGLNIAFVDFRGSNVAGVNMSDSISYGMNLHSATSNGFTREQLYSTTIYKEGSLESVKLSDNNLAGWDLSNQNLGRTSFQSSNLSSANFTGATLYYTDFTDTTSRGFTEQQYTSTYTANGRSVVGVKLNRNDLSGWDLSASLFGPAEFRNSVLVGSNLAGSSLKAADFYNSDLSNANLAYAHMLYADLTASNLSGAYMYGTDLRSATGVTDAQLSRAADTRNLIRPNGDVLGGLRVNTGELLLIRDFPYPGRAGIPQPLPRVRHGFTVEEGAILRLVLNYSSLYKQSWQSTIVFDPEIDTVYLNGTLEIRYDWLVTTTTQPLFDNSFRPFDWTGVTVDGEFDQVVVDPLFAEMGLELDLSNLYTTGRVRIVPEPTASALLGVCGIYMLRRKC